LNFISFVDTCLFVISIDDTVSIYVDNAVSMVKPRIDIVIVVVNVAVVDSVVSDNGIVFGIVRIVVVVIAGVVKSCKRFHVFKSSVGPPFRTVKVSTIA